MRVDRLVALKARVLAEAKRFRAGRWFGEVRGCGTVGCFAGHAAMLRYPSLRVVVEADAVDAEDAASFALYGRRSNGETVHVIDTAKDWLELTDAQADRLFYPRGQIGELLFRATPGSKAAAQLAGAYLDEFLRVETAEVKRAR
jgi:threonine dehydrogenase-like Zn-dependent dehydrogenase